MKRSLFTFVSPVSQEETVKLIYQAICALGGKMIQRNGYWECSWKAGLLYRAIGYEFYIGQVVRVMPRIAAETGLSPKLNLKKDGIDTIWGYFVNALLKQDSRFNLSAGEPVVGSIMFADGEVQQVFTTRHRPAYGKAMLGGALFGEVGAVLGGMGGKSYTTSVLRPARDVYMKVRMSNGRVREGTLAVDSREYNQIMANIQRV